MGRKVGADAPLSMRELGPHLTQFRLGRGLSPYQVVSLSIQPFGTIDMYRALYGRLVCIRKLRVGLCPFPWGGELHGSPPNAMWPSRGLRLTSIPSDILIHLTVWPQDRQTDRQTDRHTDSVLRTFLQIVTQPVEIQTLSSLTLMTHVDFLLRTFVAQLVAATKICSQPRQNAVATKHATNMTSSVTDE